MSKITVLAEGQITPSDAIVVVLVEPADMPNSIVIHWPNKATVSDPQRFPEVAAAIVRLFSEAATKLANIKARRRL
jgi:hypothetical protein